jgi:hypothetical protein
MKGRDDVRELLGEDRATQQPAVEAALEEVALIAVLLTDADVAPTVAAALLLQTETGDTGDAEYVEDNVLILSSIHFKYESGTVSGYINEITLHLYVTYW